MNWATDLATLYVPGDGTAKVFGVVLYTRAHANINHVLNDKCYWEAFDEISGPRWNVFAIKAKPGRYDCPNTPPGTLAYMVPVWKEPNANKALLRDFGLNSTEQLPCLAIFAPTDSGELFATAIQLSDSSVDEAYASIRKALSLVASALEGVLAEHLPDLGAYRAVEMSILSHRHWRRLKTAGRVLVRIVNAVG